MDTKTECVIAIVVTGMPGSGKSIFSETAREMGFEVYVMGDVVRRELVRRGLPITRSNMAMVAVELRKIYGDDFVAKMTVGEVFSSRGGPEGCRYVVIDGSRSLREIEVFRKSFSEVIIVGIHASPKTRFARLSSRGREGDPKSWEEFAARDSLELSLGLGGVIAMADIMIVNDGIDIQEFRRRAVEVLRGIARKDPGRS
ncbi:MAG: AAA family ATPase [Sulfolobales archaeon]